MLRPVSTLLVLTILAIPAAAPAAALLQGGAQSGAPGGAQTQAPAVAGPTAAARLPNTFDRPQMTPGATPGAAPRTAPVPSPAPSGPPPAEAVDPAREAASEAMLRKTVAAMQAGAPNYADMADDLAAKVREQSTAITPLIQSFGPMQTMAHVGVENGADLFMVGFENQITQWIIARNEEGKIVALLFRPATPPAPAG